MGNNPLSYIDPLGLHWDCTNQNAGECSWETDPSGNGSGVGAPCVGCGGGGSGVGFGWGPGEFQTVTMYQWQAPSISSIQSNILGSDPNDLLGAGYSLPANQLVGGGLQIWEALAFPLAGLSSGFYGFLQNAVPDCRNQPCWQRQRPDCTKVPCFRGPEENKVSARRRPTKTECLTVPGEAVSPQPGDPREDAPRVEDPATSPSGAAKANFILMILEYFADTINCFSQR